MDEQNLQQQSVSSEPSEAWDASADGPAYTESEATANEDYSSEDYSSEPTTPTEVVINDDGEVEFSDEFFGDTVQDKPEAPPLYTQDELRQTPFEQWDINRLEGDVRDFVPLVREQMQRRQMELSLAQRPTTPPMFNAPQQYTPKELAEDAQKLACEKLGLEDPDDFDEYESEHRAALNLAMQELSNKRSAEVAAYQRVENDYRELQNFNAALVRQPDYAEFDRWFSEKLREAKVTPAQVDAGLTKYIRQSGGDYRSIQGIISNWYQEFRAERGRSSTTRSTPRTNRPPVLEGSGGGGGSYEGRRSIDMRQFGNLDPDGQAQALMRMGIV